jgi:hypothetical protein
MDTHTVRAMKLTTYSDNAVLHTIEIWRDEPTSESDAETLREQLEAMTTFARGWMEPLAVAIGVHCFDPERDHEIHGAPRPPAVPYWHVRASNVPGRVDQRETRSGSRIDVRSEIDPLVIAEVVTNATSQPCADDGCSAELEWIEWTACRVRLPDLHATQFLVDDNAGRIAEIPIEIRSDGLWISGPMIDAMTGPPVRLSMVEGAFRIDVIWDLWQKGAGRASLDAAVARVLARDTGWYVV